MALALVVDLAGNAYLFLARGEHKEAAGKGNPGCEEGALAAIGFLDHLDKNFLSKTQDILNGRILLAANKLLGGGVVLRVYLVYLQEAVLFRTKVHEGGLQIDVDVDDDAAVDVALELLLVEHIKIVLVQDAVVRDGNLYLFARKNADVHAALVCVAYACLGTGIRTSLELIPIYQCRLFGKSFTLGLDLGLPVALATSATSAAALGGGDCLLFACLFDLTFA